MFDCILEASVSQGREDSQKCVQHQGKTGSRLEISHN